MSRRGFRAAGIALGYTLDRAFADPQRFHPVAGFGQVAAVLEIYTYRDTKLAGAAHTTALLAAVTVAGWAAERAARRSATATVIVTAVATWATLGGTSLVRVGAQMSEHLYDDNIDDARALLPSLCGRDPSLLDVGGIARATVESLAENTSDAHTGPLVWAALAGVPGALAYRAANTLDAMIGHKIGPIPAIRLGGSTVGRPAQPAPRQDHCPGHRGCGPVSRGLSGSDAARMPA